MLDLDSLDAEFSTIIKAADGSASVSSSLAKAYDDYAKKAVIAGADCSQGGNKDLLIVAFSSDNTPATIDRMAANLCAYWQSLPVPGTPAHGGVSVVAVLPAFASLVSAMTTAVKGCVTTSQFEKPYKRLFSAVEAVLKTVPVIVTEMMPTTPTAPAPFPEILQ